MLVDIGGSGTSPKLRQLVLKLTIGKRLGSALSLLPLAWMVVNTPQVIPNLALYTVMVWGLLSLLVEVCSLFQKSGGEEVREKLELGYNSGVVGSTS